MLMPILAIVFLLLGITFMILCIVGNNADLIIFPMGFIFVFVLLVIICNTKFKEKHYINMHIIEMATMESVAKPLISMYYFSVDDTNITSCIKSASIYSTEYVNTILREIPSVVTNELGYVVSDRIICQVLYGRNYYNKPMIGYSTIKILTDTEYKNIDTLNIVTHKKAISELQKHLLFCVDIYK